VRRLQAHNLAHRRYHTLPEIFEFLRRRIVDDRLEEFTRQTDGNGLVEFWSEQGRQNFQNSFSGQRRCRLRAKKSSKFDEHVGRQPAGCRI